MTPPIIAHALIAAAAPPSDYDVIAGDLHEEYLRRVQAHGVEHANRWYWSQALRSIPTLLSYSRAPRSFTSTMSSYGAVVAILFGMLFAKDFIDELVHRSQPLLSSTAYFFIDWAIAAIFGLILAMVLNRGGVRVALGASIFMLLAFALPIVIGVSPRLPIGVWILLLGAIPAMALGAGTLQVIRRR